MKRNTPLKHTPFKPKSYDLEVQKQLSTNKGYIYPMKSTIHLKRYRTQTVQGIKIGDKTLKLWSLRFADYEWSLWIRIRDKKCQKCGSTENLTNSHFHRRGHNSVRFHPDNCDTFCLFCHAEWEAEKKGAYKDWKIKQLGQERFDSLEKLANTTLSQGEAIRNVMIYLEARLRPRLSEILKDKEININ